MVTVEADVDVVERRLVAGELSCPECGGVLAGWGRARPRRLRGPGGPVRLCPRRSRCTGCGVTHVLLPVTALLRRADAAGVIVSALAAKASRRVGFRRIAAELARPAETVRGWLRRFAGRAEAVRSVLAGLGEMEVARIAMHPGSVQGFGQLGADGVPVFLLPANPVSALVVFEVMVRPLKAINMLHQQMGAMLDRLKQGQAQQQQ